MVEDPRHELGEFLVLTVAVDGEGVGGDGRVDYIVREGDAKLVEWLQNFS